MLHTYKTISFSTMALLASVSAFASVTQSGKWSESTTWSDGLVPTTSSAAPYTNLSFDSSGLNLQVDGNQFADRIQLGSNAQTNISIDAGKTLTLKGMYDNTAYYYISAASASDKLTISGAGTLVLDKTNETRFEKGDITLDVNVTATSGAFYLYRSGVASKLAINKNFNAGSKQANFGDWAVTFNEGSSATSGYIIASGSLSIAKGVTYAAKGGANISNMTLNGALNISGMRNYVEANEKWAARVTGTNVFSSTSSMTSSDTTSASRILFGGTTTSYAGVNALSFGGSFFMQYNLVLNLNSSNAIKTNNAAGQGSSTFNIVNYYLTYDKATSTSTEHFDGSKVTINLGADNDFGKFVFKNGSELTLNANGNKVNIGSIGIYDLTGSQYTLVLQNLTDFTIKINSLENITTETDDIGTYALEIVTYIDDFKNNVYLVEDTENGGWWLNAGVVPEPAAFAFILGGIALAMAIARRRK